MKYIYTLCLSILLILPYPSLAQSIKLDRIIAISDNYILNGESGNNYILAALHIPEKNSPIHQQLLHILSKRLLGKEVKIKIPDNSTDRYKRLHVHIYDSENNWINGQLIEQGLAILSGANNGPIKLNELRALEKKAERNNLGYWGTGDFQAFTALSYKGPFYKFIIVEGLVLQTKKVKAQLYINFEEDWRKDFSLSIKKALWKNFSKAGVNLEALAGKKIRVRGWVRKYNGPFLDIHDLSQLEIL